MPPGLVRYIAREWTSPLVVRQHYFVWTRISQLRNVLAVLNAENPNLHTHTNNFAKFRYQIIHRWNTLREIFSIRTNETWAIYLAQVVAGVLASTTNDYLHTSSAWKCTKQSYSNWMQTNFDDYSSPNAWPIAVDEHLNDASDIHGALPPISPAAAWIWTQNYASTTIDTPVYCRGYFRELTICLTFVTW